nr:sugar ABC transporter ATP-binding protein [uncultured Blautia sp.]
MNEQSILKVNHISKYYSGVKALDDVSFQIRRGEMHAICGENGAGKSTLIKILTGAIKPTKGDFEFDGQTYQSMNPSESMSVGIRAIYQEFTLVPYLSVADNLFYGRELHKGLVRDVKKMEEETRKLCESIGISIDPKTKVANLGIAQQQIVEILKAVSYNAKLYIMDEPTAPLTVNETETFFNIIRRLKEQGATIIFISHRLEEVFELCDRVTVFTDGKCIVTKDIKDVNRKSLIAYMVGRVLGMSVERNTTYSVLDRMLTGGLYISKKLESACSSRFIKELRIKTPSGKQLVKNLSGGNQQKVVLAKMMAADCDILIFDEPTRGIDVGAKQEIYTLMREITAKGKSIIMISSEMPELIGMSDRIIVMSEGKVSGELSREEFSQETILPVI